MSILTKFKRKLASSSSFGFLLAGIQLYRGSFVVCTTVFALQYSNKYKFYTLYTIQYLSGCWGRTQDVVTPASRATIELHSSFNLLFSL